MLFIFLFSLLPSSSLPFVPVVSSSYTIPSLPHSLLQPTSFSSLSPLTLILQVSFFLSISVLFLSLILLLVLTPLTLLVLCLGIHTSGSSVLSGPYIRSSTFPFSSSSSSSLAAPPPLLLLSACPWPLHVPQSPLPRLQPCLSFPSPPVVLVLGCSLSLSLPLQFPVDAIAFG